jgi:acyl-CoA reductase-like NAD-dependent aldehyde dehydrogenase
MTTAMGRTTARFPSEFDREYPMIIGSDRRGGSSGEVMRCLDPYEDREWGRVPVATAADVDTAVLAARRALEDREWALAPPVVRAAMLRRLADLVDVHLTELALMQTAENGKTIGETTLGTQFLSMHARYLAGLAENLTGRSIQTSMPNMTVYTLRDPVGVVAAITPWNSPLGLLAPKLLPALAAGCTIVIKPSEVTSTSTVRLAELCLEAGFPAGVVNVVTGAAATGAALASHREVDKVAFTGSTAAGKLVLRAAADRVARVTLELGGKSPNIVFADADLDNAVHGVMAGIFAAAGQTCMAGSRVLVEDQVHDEFVERLSKAAAGLRLGDPLDSTVDLGPLACRPQFDKVLSYIDLGKSEGAKVVAGGRRDQSEGNLQGLFVLPTIFTDVKNSSRLAQEEVFGPVASIIRFSGEDEAIRLANDVDFGLAAGVWTSNVQRGCRMTKRLRAGTVWINAYRLLHYSVPFGGVKQSGLGRELGPDALLPYTEEKVVWVDEGNPQLFGRH